LVLGPIPEQLVNIIETSDHGKLSTLAIVQDDRRS
jgi:hypothetical protein